MIHSDGFLSVQQELQVQIVGSKVALGKLLRLNLPYTLGHHAKYDRHKHDPNTVRAYTAIYKKLQRDGSELDLV